MFVNEVGSYGKSKAVILAKELNAWRVTDRF